MKREYYIGRVDEPAGKKGWLVGSFLKENHPCFSKDVEVGWKNMDLSTREGKHIHEEAIEVWVVIKGSVAAIIDGDHLVIKEGKYVVVHPFIPTEILNAEEGTIVLVVKAPSVPEDKYPCLS